eukprot:UN28266
MSHKLWISTHCPNGGSGYNCYIFFGLRIRTLKREEKKKHTK